MKMPITSWSGRRGDPVNGCEPRIEVIKENKSADPVRGWGRMGVYEPRI